MKHIIKILLAILVVATVSSQASEQANIGQKIADLCNQVQEFKSQLPDDNSGLNGYEAQTKSRKRIEHRLGVKIVAGIIQEEQKDPSFFEKVKNYATPMLISAVITGAVTVVNKYLLTSAEERAIMLEAQKQQIQINKLAIEQQRQELEARKVIIKEAQLKQLAEEKAELEKLIAEMPDKDKEKFQIMFQKFCKQQARELMNNRQTELLLQVKPA
ncbi:MAG: hypothetical protein ACOYT8_06630 [Candidatus Dependentiae bacterium]